MSGHTWSKLVAILESAALDDLLIPGVSETLAGVRRFRPSFDRIYRVFGNTTIMASAINQGDHVKIALTNEIELDNLGVEDNEAPCLAQLSSMFFGEFDRIRCIGAKGYTDDLSNPTLGIFKGIDLILDGGHVLSMDPLWTFDLKISPVPYIKPLHRWHPLSDAGLGLLSWDRQAS